MRFAIIGSGAVGGYYGALLVKAGFDVHFLFNSDYHHVEANGLEVESPNGWLLYTADGAHDESCFCRGARCLRDTYTHLH